jgi:hypothetical protein
MAANALANSTPHRNGKLPVIERKKASFLVISALLMVKGANGGELLDAPNFGGGWSKKKNSAQFLQ